MNKSDPNDARGLAELIRGGWDREVKDKSDACQATRSLIVARAQLGYHPSRPENQVRSLLSKRSVEGACRSKGDEAMIGSWQAQQPKCPLTA